MSPNSLEPTLTPRRMCAVILAAAFMLLVPVGGGAFVSAQSPAHDIQIVSDASGQRLQVDGEDLMVLGMNWDYFPIGTTNPSYDFWGQPDDFIETALAREMSLLRAMGVNVIRVYVGIPARWIEYIYDNYGIYTVLNHAMARYGYTLDGVWMPNTDYSNPRLRAAVQEEVLAIVEEFRYTRGLLMWLLGNENNYGLVWSSAETEGLPEGERDAARARHLYSLFGDVGRAMKRVDPHTPIAMANGDLQYLEIIAEETRGGLDVFGTNTYRGISFLDLYQRVRDVMGLPVMLTEFGSDAWNAKEMREDQVMQARYLIEQWREIYEQSAGKGMVGNSIGGMTFQWTDGWWKMGQDRNLDIQDVTASWANDAYPDDYVEGRNNMNEEWWGIAAKGPTDQLGFFQIYPRAAFYALQQAYTLDPYGPDTDLATIRRHFGAISAEAAALQARGDRASMLVEDVSRFRVTGVRAQFETFNTGGTRTSTPPSTNRSDTDSPAFRGFDYLQSFYTGFKAQPSERLSGEFSFNLLGHVPENTIEEIFYENPGIPKRFEGVDEQITLSDIERIRLYRASIRWEEDLFELDGFFRTGHFHWGYEGDFFGLYREANYGENIDIYNGQAPFGVEITGRGSLEGLAAAFGPELWWGANPAVLLRYGRTIGPFDVTAIFHEDLAEQAQTNSSFAIPVPPTRKATLQATTTFRGLDIELGGIWSGNTKVGDTYQIAEPTGDTYTILQDEVEHLDTFGAKARLSYSAGPINWYAEGALMGIVADAGPPTHIIYTGWGLRNWGSGNNNIFLSGFTYQIGDFQIGPNFQYQKPIVGPIPAGVPAPGRPRNILDDPFSVRGGNRETIAGELMITFDPTPATWLWNWDNITQEDAPFAASLGIVFRHLPTTQDAAIGILADGRTAFAFPGATPARDLWEARARFVGAPTPKLRYNVNLYGGQGEPNGDSQRLIKRYGMDGRVAFNSFMVSTYAKINDWGPYDYHRDFNNTFPLQLMGDISHTVGVPKWFGEAQTRLGIRALWRSLDVNSPRFCPVSVTNSLGAQVCNPNALGSNGNEWEIRTYLDFWM